MPSKGSWDKAQEAMENQGSSTFLRLENDGDKAIVAFAGSPFNRDICFNEKTRTYEAWDDAAKAAGRKKTTRYAMNVYVANLKGAEVNEMKVVDMNFQTMTTVIALKDKYGFSKCFFEITRSGAKGDSKTTYHILPDKDVTAEHLAIFGGPDPKDRNGWIEGTVKLIDLEEATARDGGDTDGSAAVTDDVKRDAGKKLAKTNGTIASAATHAPAPAAAAAPAAQAGAVGTECIAKATSTEIIEKLKPLDPEKGIRPFLAKFPYAKKVSEIRLADEGAARELAGRLAGGPAPAEDPFA